MYWAREEDRLGQQRPEELDLLLVAGGTEPTTLAPDWLSEHVGVLPDSSRWRKGGAGGIDQERHGHAQAGCRQGSQTVQWPAAIGRADRGQR